MLRIMHLRAPIFHVGALFKMFRYANNGPMYSFIIYFAYSSAVRYLHRDTRDYYIIISKTRADHVVHGHVIIRVGIRAHHS